MMSNSFLNFLSSDFNFSFPRSEFYQIYDINNLRKLENRDLEGHAGCVNRLAWNQSGTMLASVSDDCHLNIWSYSQGHSRNMFGVAWMHEDQKIITGAMDCQVRIIRLDLQTSIPFTCHTDRVKTVLTEPMNPNMFWSCAEDGSVRQFDVRESHVCSEPIRPNYSNFQRIFQRMFRDPVTSTCNNAIIKTVEIKSFAMFDNEIAVGCVDEYIRIYDRRMLSIGLAEQINSNFIRAISPIEVTGFSEAGLQLLFKPSELTSLPAAAGRNGRGVSCTHLSYSPNGNHILATFHKENAYLFSRNSELKSVFIPNENERNDILRGAEVKKSDGNLHFDLKNYTISIFNYSDALKELGLSIVTGTIIEHFALNFPERCKTASIILSNRAACYLKRNFIGDNCSAMIDLIYSNKLDPEYAKNYYRIASCLHNMNYDGLALEYILYVQNNLKKLQENKELNSLKVAVKLSHDKKIENEEEKFPENIDSKFNLNQSFEVYERFIGHRNVRTDIKEAAFIFGGEYIACGSDDGCVYIYQSNGGKLVHIIPNVDPDVVNCIAAHPFEPVFATSGIADVIKLWEPTKKKLSNSFQISEEDLKSNQEDLLNTEISEIPMETFITRILAFENRQQ